MRTVALVGSLLIGFALALAPGCDVDGCPEKICSDCSAMGDCNITCKADEIQVCRAHPEGDRESRQRCTYCEKR